MAKKKVTKLKKTTKKGWSILKVFEILVVLGSLAAVAVKMLQGKKGR